MILTRSSSLLQATAVATILIASNVQAVPMTSIADSWHNLGLLNSKTETPSGNVPAKHSLDTSEICVFCHTPHGGDNTAAVPIWNRQLNYPRFVLFGLAHIRSTTTVNISNNHSTKKDFPIILARPI